MELSEKPREPEWIPKRGDQSSGFLMRSGGQTDINLSEEEMDILIQDCKEELQRNRSKRVHIELDIKAMKKKHAHLLTQSEHIKQEQSYLELLRAGINDGVPIAEYSPETMGTLKERMAQLFHRLQTQFDGIDFNESHDPLTALYSDIDTPSTPKASSK